MVIADGPVAAPGAADQEIGLQDHCRAGGLV